MAAMAVVGTGDKLRKADKDDDDDGRPWPWSLASLLITVSRRVDQ